MPVSHARERLPPVDPEIARSIAYYSHHGRRDRLGELQIEHVTRVVAAVPPPPRTTAWLHDVLQPSDTPAPALREGGMTPLEARALDPPTPPGGGGGRPGAGAGRAAPPPPPRGRGLRAPQAAHRPRARARR